MTLIRSFVVLSLVCFGCVGGINSGVDGDSREEFAQSIVPIFERDCGTSACHAAEDGRFEELDPTYFVFPVDDEGRITGADRVDRAYQRAIEKLAAEGAKFADLVRKPLDESLGGQAHRGGSQYRTMGDPALEALMGWADRARPVEPEVLSPLEQRFREEIQPILAEKRCMLSSCHGASASNLLIFDPGFLGEQDANSTRTNYAKVVLHLNYETPDPMLSRLIRKTIPQEQGGIFHRGGNDFFDPAAGDLDLERIVAYVRDARSSLEAEGTGEAIGVVFAATDPTPRGLFDVGVWQPGGDIYSLVPAAPGGTLTNLTAAAHGAPADIRDPALSYDGQRIAFAMRRSEDDCLNLYVMNLDGSGLTQLTNDTGVQASGVKVANVEPLWGPDDRIYFVSTRAGVRSLHADVPLSNLYRIDADGRNLLRMTFNPGNEVAPAWRFAAPPGHDGPEQRTLDLTFTAVRNVGSRMHAPLMRVPPDFHADYHPHYGTQHPEYRVFTQMTQLPDHREALILADDANVWEGGALAIIDRNLGPVIHDAGTPAVVNYVDSLRVLGSIGENVRHTGASPDGYYRDPYAMPDGSLLVVHQDSAIDHTDATAMPDPGLYRVVLRDLSDNRVIIARKELLVDVPGKVESDPRPIQRKRREYIGDPLHHLDNAVTHGELLNFDLAVSLTVAEQDSPSNTKAFDDMADRVKYVRLVEEVPAPPGVQVGRGMHGIRRVLGEFAATPDRSVYVRLPAGVPFYIQALDHTRSSTSTFNQWFWVLPGEKLKQVTRREVWNTRCGGCHGSRSGVPGDTVSTPDVLSEASRVVANYDPVTRSDLSPIPFGLEVDERMEIDFARDVQPVLTERCATAGCHVAGATAPDLSARAGAQGFSGAYEALTAAGTASTGGFAYVDPNSTSARTSYLAEVLMKADLQAPRSFDSSGCDGADRLSLSELGLLMRWIDLGASFVGIGPRTAPQLPTY